MNYTLHQLQVFLKITETLSITKAAEELHLTQPAVSIQLKKFQDQFDVPLTEVLGRKIYITEFGKEMASAARRILREAHDINNKTLAYKGLLSGTLKISIVSTGKYIMPYFLSEFLKMHPGVELAMDVTNKAKVIESLENNQVDFSLVSVLPRQIQIEKIDLMPNKLYLVGNQPLKKGTKPFSKSIFQQLPLIFREQGSGTRYVMERFIERNHVPVQKKMELATNEAVKQAVIAGLGYSIMPIIGIKNELGRGDLHIMPVKGLPVTSTWCLVWPKGKRFSPAAEAYLSFLRKEKMHIISSHFKWYEEYI